jgi:glutamate racemase
LSELMEQARIEGLRADTLVLGCTHYPLLRAQIERAVPEGMRVIDSAAATADQVAHAQGAGAAGKASPQARFFATDSVAKFRALGSRFLGRAIDQVELVDLGG